MQAQAGAQIQTSRERARARLESAIESVLQGLVRDTIDIGNTLFAVLAPTDVADALLRCAEGVSLNLRRLEMPSARPSYAEAGCSLALVALQLPASAWRDLQSCCGHRITEVLLPDMFGSHASLAGLRGLRSLRSISMALDAGSRTVDLRTLDDFQQPMHVDLRCRVREPIEVIAPEGVSVCAEVEGGILEAAREPIPCGESALGYFDRAVRVATIPGVRLRLAWPEPPHPVARAAATGAPDSWIARLFQFFRPARSLPRKAVK